MVDGAERKMVKAEKRNSTANSAETLAAEGVHPASIDLQAPPAVDLPPWTASS